MSYLDKITLCNQADYTRFIPLMVSDERVGWVRRDFLDPLKEFTDAFIIGSQAVAINPKLDNPEARTTQIDKAVHALRETGHIDRYYGETYPASTDHRERPLFLIDRGVASYFGTRTYGQHLNGYVEKPDGLYMWIGRRARDRGYAPGKLDQLVAGGLPYQIDLADNLRKECHEEAGMEPTLADQARPVGCITCAYENERGIKPDTLYCYDLELPADFEPVCHDGEVDEFMLMPIQEVQSLVRDSDEFKLNCNLVVIDFLVRWGYITPDEPDYEAIVNGLHRL